MKSFVKFHLCHVQKRLKNVDNILMKQQKFKTLKFAESSAKFTCIKLRSYLNKHRSFKTIDQVEFT